ncbi:solute carrier family 2, facilitated glucose transporter member 5-like [Gigantopelta aegis]|uniref:solute carrier family 2, facilitated glucose transporter member 5-like n=1 Tax=Gigantopelta aegis TaxID=1735272 RepID=UPI001B88D8DE|nr:solute carrier family 2, facilitated glucose transporter member 5-like [Gigantopelta aegis]XP_041378150.1 solute carrier family 2, facilitated glucose transporter member 5-like [Gigantopelta aegis]XP_041378151.1 solute carrier family 2, facilitated glucose transporter member 5-like [Gigantopelta aegis]
MAEDEVKYTFTLVFSVTIAVFGNSFLYGYQIGVINTPASLIKAFYNETYYERNGGNWTSMQKYDVYITEVTAANQTDNSTNKKPDDAYKTPAEFGVDTDKLLKPWELELLWSSTVAAFVLFGMIGAFLSAKLADIAGRKKGMLMITVIMFAAAIFGGITLITKSPECLIVSRILVGLHSGLNISLAPLYLAEISPKKIRGAIGTCHQLGITIGILSSQIFGLPVLLGTSLLWPYLFAFNAFPSLVCLILLPLCPESPRWLLIRKGEDETASALLKKLRGYDNVEEELEEMRLEAKTSGGVRNFTLKELVTTPELRMPTIIACVSQVAQQWSGINAVMSYSSFIFAQAQVPDQYIPYVIVGTGTINVICTVIAVPLMEKLGRRPLLIWPMCVMAAAFLLMTVFLELQFDVSLADHHTAFAMTCIVLMHIYVIGFALGLGPIPFIVVSEIFRQEARAAAMSLSLAFNWICNFILMLTFPFLKDGLGAYTYLLFTAILVGAIAFIFFFVPETKNKTFDEIAASIAFGRARGQTKNYKFDENDETTPMDNSKV